MVDKKYNTLLEKLKEILRIDKASSVKLLTIQEQANDILENDTLISFDANNHTIQVGEYPDASSINTSISDIEGTTNYLFKEANDLSFSDPSAVISQYYARLAELEQVLFQTMPEKYIDPDNPLYIGYDLKVSNSNNLIGGSYLSNGTLTNMTHINVVPALTITPSINSTRQERRIMSFGKLLSLSPYEHSPANLVEDGIDVEIYRTDNTKLRLFSEQMQYDQINIADTPSDIDKYDFTITLYFGDTIINYCIIRFNQVIEDIRVDALTKNVDYIVESYNQGTGTLVTIFNISAKIVTLRIYNHDDLSSMDSYKMTEAYITYQNMFSGDQRTIVVLRDTSSTASPEHIYFVGGDELGV